MLCPTDVGGQISWHYDRAEIIADGVVHAIGVCLGLIGATTIVVMAVKIERINLVPILVYAIGLVTMLAFSAAYNAWSAYDRWASLTAGPTEDEEQRCMTVPLAPPNQSGALFHEQVSNNFLVARAASGIVASAADSAVLDRCAWRPTAWLGM